MALGWLLLAIAGVWGAVFLLLKVTDTFFYPGVVQQLLVRAGVTLRLGYFSWDTPALNALIERGARKRSAFFAPWFAAGVYVGLLLMVAAVVLLLCNLWMYARAPTHEQGVDDLVLTPLVPGVNVHGANLVYLFLALFVSAVFHELGHAFAAALHHQPIQSVGTFLFFLYPGAYVSFEGDFEDLEAFKKLQIYCAGVYHNLVLAAFALLYFYAIAVFALPLYSTTEGVVIRSVDEGFADRLHRGDVLTSIGGCNVREIDWTECPFHYTVANEPTRRFKSSAGVCVDRKSLRGASKECCNDESLAMDRGGCFAKVGVDEERWTEGDVNVGCLDLKDTLSGGNVLCTSTSECSGEEQVCVVHVTQYAEHVVTALHTSGGEVVLFQGGPWLLHFHLQLSAYVPRYSWVPLGIPDEAKQLALFVASVSAALGLLNLAPALMLDGQHALAAYIDLFFPRTPYPTRLLYFRSVLYCGSALFVLNVVVSLFTLT
eukprot:TRINITY_DN2702_c0_g2_i1.p1 TRINITY_DN2702_c0_g2~~TRINITY_DN2702_c0_g2_i1.p1  ORF type:complete len:487 (+),score=123.08 TRINITY_DN2702_c0_g2_i1:343-1803(+)